jgi:hypothetical protein
MQPALPFQNIFCVKQMGRCYCHGKAMQTMHPTQLWGDLDFTDVTLATADDRQIKTHKIIISSCSPFFRNILVKNQHKHPLIYLKDIHYKELEMVLKFIYLGQCYVDKGDLQNFLATGKDLEVNGLMKDIQNSPDPNYDSKTLEDNETMASTTKSEVPTVLEQDEMQSNAKVKCDEGGQGDAQQTHLSQHMQSNHKGLRYFCDQCDSQFRHQKSLIQHKKYTHDTKDIETSHYDCNECTYIATTKSGMGKHKQAKHEGIRFTCDQCTHQATQKAHLNRHKKIKHGDYSCELCDFECVRKGRLTAHIVSKHDVPMTSQHEHKQ